MRKCENTENPVKTLSILTLMNIGLYEIPNRPTNKNILNTKYSTNQKVIKPLNPPLEVK